MRLRKDDNGYGALVYVAVALVIVGLMAGMYIVAGQRLETAPSPLKIEPNTDAWTKGWCGAGNPDFYMRGHFDNPSGNAGDHNGEIFERSTIWFSWTAQGESFPIIASLELANCGWYLPSYPTSMYYKFLYTEDKKTWVGFGTPDYAESIAMITTRQWTGWTVAEIGSKTFTIHGYHFTACTRFNENHDAHTISCAESKPDVEIQDGAIVRVEIWGGCDWAIGGYTDTLLGSDELALRSAIPYIHAVRATYKVGETAQWEYRIPTTTKDDGDPAYFIQIIDCNNDTPLPGYDRVGLTAISGKVDVEVKESMISHELGKCQNRLRGLLWSDLIVAALSDASLWSDSVIETGMVKPVVTDVKFNQGFYHEGDPIVLTWTGTGNETSFHVSIDLNGMLVYDDDVAGNVNTVTVNAARAGTIQAQVTPVNKCWMGEVKRYYAIVSGAPKNVCEAYPELDMCKNNNKNDLIGLIIAALCIIFLFIGFFALVWAFSHYDVPLSIGLLSSGVVILVAAIVLIGLGAFDALLLQMSGTLRVVLATPGVVP
jgi:hypothetical protein